MRVDPGDGADRVGDELVVVQVQEPVVAAAVAVLDEPVDHRAEHVDPHRTPVARPACCVESESGRAVTDRLALEATVRAGSRCSTTIRASG